MKAIILSALTGLISSVAASYVYAQLSKVSVSGYSIAAGALVISCIIWLFLLVLPRLRLMMGSEISAYYPRGQRQFISKLLSELNYSQTLIIIGARGLDLIGERSPLGAKLAQGKWKGTIEAFLLSPESSHARVRGDALSIERQKYEAESRSVESFLGVLALRYDVSATTYVYDAPPLIRAFILDESAYVGFYQHGIQGRLLPTYRIRTMGRLNLELKSYCKRLTDTAFVHSYKAGDPNATIRSKP